MSIEETIVATVRTAVREEMRSAMKEALAEAPSIGGDHLIDTVQAAEMGHCHEETVRRLVRKGVLQRCGTGRRILVRRSEWAAYLNGHHINGKPRLTSEAAAAAFLARKRRKKADDETPEGEGN